MEAGKGFDAIIARQVMGWTKATLHDDVTGPEAYWCMGGKAMAPVDSFTPSTDIASAWEVVEKLRAQGHHTILSPHDEGWALTILNAFTSGEDLVATAHTAPLAICLAALKAVQP